MDFFSFVHIDQLFQIYFSVWTINYLQSFQPVKNKCITDFYIAQVFDRHFFHVKFFLFAAVATVREWKYARNYINYGQLNIQPNQQRMCRIFFFRFGLPVSGSRKKNIRERSIVFTYYRWHLMCVRVFFIGSVTSVYYGEWYFFLCHEFFIQRISIYYFLKTKFYSKIRHKIQMMEFWGKKINNENKKYESNHKALWI